MVTSIPLVDAQLDEKITIRRRSWLQRLWHQVFRPLSSGVRALIWLLGAILTVLACYALLSAGGATRQMSGDVNVMVASFLDPRSPAYGEGLSESIARSLKTSSLSPGLSGPLDLQVRGPVSGEPPSSPAEARDLAWRNGAQVLVYGSVTYRRGRFVANPRLFVDPRWLLGAEELGGSYALGPIDLGSAPAHNAAVGRVRLRQVIANRLSGLSDFALALGWFDLGRWRSALTRLQRVRSDGMSQLAALASVFEGNSAGKLGWLAKAHKAYEAALKQDGNLERARFGLTEVSFHRAGRGCGDRAEMRGLQKASARFRAIAARADGKTLATAALHLRAVLGWARTDYCLSQAGLANRWHSARLGFRRVLHLTSDWGMRFRSEMAQAHGWLGFAMLPTSFEVSGAAAAYHRAQSHFQEALRLAGDRASVNQFKQMTAFVASRLERLN